MENKKIAVVTGANRGIGFQICHDLATDEHYKVILTSRNESKGKEAADKLKAEGLDVDFMVLDVSEQKSVNDFADALEQTYGRCDVLVNNAGIFPDSTSAAGSWPGVMDTSIETMKKGMQTNVYGPMMMIKRIVPIMRKNKYGRIVNLSSGMGQLTHMNGGCPSYRLSKTSLNALTRVCAEEFKGTNILVNSMCPGWVKTDMGGPGATRSLAEGAETAVFLATLPDGGPTGKFFRDKKEFEW